MNSKSKQVLRGGLGLIVGYAAAVLLSVGTTFVLQLFLAVARTPDPPTWYHAFDFTYSWFAMAIGGYVAARVAGGLGASLVLASVVLVLGGLTAVSGADPLHPALYQWLIALMGPIAIVLGGRRASSRPIQATATLDATVLPLNG